MILENSPEPSASNASLKKDVLRGAVGFAIVSIAGFALWAFAGKWFQKHGGEAGLYAASTVVFLGLSGVLLHPLLRGSKSLARFYKIFIPAFFAYAVVWCAAWFLLHFGWGEWLGSLLGSMAFVALIGRNLGTRGAFIKATLVMFAFHSAGYFLGGILMHHLIDPKGPLIVAGLSKAQVGITAKLSWGLLYGLGFGAGIGYVFSVFQGRE
jgi:hypothetical protein